MGDLLGGGGGGERGEGRQGGRAQGEGTVAAVFALHPPHLPRPPLQQQTQGTPCKGAAPAGCGAAKRGSTGPLAGTCARFNLSLQRGTPRWHATLCGPGMTCRNMSPLVNISLFLPNFSGVIHNASIAMAGSRYISLCIIFPPAFRAGKVQRPEQHLKGR